MAVVHLAGRFGRHRFEPGAACHAGLVHAPGWALRWARPPLFCLLVVALLPGKWVPYILCGFHEFV